MKMQEQLDSISVRVTKDIRHADKIDPHDPEAQRILQLVVAGLREAYNLAIPPDGGKTTHITTDKDIQFKLEGVAGIKEAKIVQEAMPAYATLCRICSAVHDPRTQYDHAAEPLRRAG